MVEIHCDKCGSASLSFPDRPDGEIGCNDCGERHGSIEALAEELIACARRRSSEALRGELRSPG